MKKSDQELEKIIFETIKEINIENAIKEKPVFSLPEMLEYKNVTNLRKMAKLHKFSGYTKMDKEELIKKISAKFLDKEMLCEILYVIDDIEWDFFQKAVAKKYIHDEHIYIDSYRILQAVGYLQSYYYEDKIYFVVPDEIKKLFSTLENTDFYNNKEYYGLLNTYVKVATSLYGIIKQDDFVELFNSINEQKTSIDEMYPILLKYIYANVGYCFYDEYIVNDVFEENDFRDVLPLAMVIEKKSRYNPPKEEFLKYSDYNYYEITPQIIALKNYINSKLIDDQDVIEDIIDEIHELCMQQVPMQDIMDIFIEYKINFESFEQAQHIVSLINEIFNNTRIWVNHGHTPHELFVKYDKPNLRSLPKEPFKANKIGRNDPCPCGSGKKYKKCCGT